MEHVRLCAPALFSALIKHVSLQGPTRIKVAVARIGHMQPAHVSSLPQNDIKWRASDVQPMLRPLLCLPAPLPSVPRPHAMTSFPHERVKLKQYRDPLFDCPTVILDTKQRTP